MKADEGADIITVIEGAYSGLSSRNMAMLSVLSYMQVCICCSIAWTRICRGFTEDCGPFIACALADELAVV